MEPKEAKVARKLLKFFPSDTDNFETIYSRFQNLLQKNSDYFNNFQLESIIKILFYIESIKSTGGIKKAEQRLQNLEFINFFYKTGEKYRESCEYCGGDEYVECSECSGSGTVNCRTCDGEGTVNCDKCDGDGEDEEGEKCNECDHGAVECDWCDGDGSENCRECDGEGRIRCDECEHGEIETDRDVYEDYFVVSWNPKFSQIMKNLTELENPWGQSDEFFEKHNKDFLILHQSDVNDYQLKDEVEDDMIYPYFVDDTPSLYRTSNYRLYSTEDPDNFIQR